MPEAHYREDDCGGCSRYSVVLRTPGGTVMTVGKQDNCWYEFITVESRDGWELVWHRRADAKKLTQMTVAPDGSCFYGAQAPL